MGTSDSAAAGVLVSDAESPEIALVLECRFKHWNLSKLPELKDCADGGVSIGVGVSSHSSSSTIVNEAGGLPTFLLNWDFMSDSIC